MWASEMRAATSIKPPSSHNPALPGPRGYLRVECRPERLAVDLRALDDVTRADSACQTLASFAVEDGQAGALRA